MTKKTIVVLALCIIMLSCAFAGKFSITGQVSPYSFQTVIMQSGNHDSTYGFGIKVGAGYRIRDNLDVGLDFNFDMFKYGEIDYSYLIFGFKAKDNVIGAHMFADCGNLRNVWLPKSVTAVEHEAFILCRALEHVYNLPKDTAPGAFKYAVRYTPGK